MSDFLVEISFGPVQSFIAAARRSRDLWAGSHILSEVVRAAAARLRDSGAELIYPVDARVREEHPGQDSNLSNVILARMFDTDEEGAREATSMAAKAARERLVQFSLACRKAWSREGVTLREDLWQAQIADALDVYCAWAEMGDEPDAYRQAYDGLKATFAARKNTRNFMQLLSTSGAAGTGLPKSSLDGLRDSVIPEVVTDRQRARFGLSSGEQLDALGVIKREVGRQERFTALTRIAAHDWLAQRSEGELATLRRAYDPLVALDLATRVRGNEGAYDAFPYDANLLFPESLDSALSAADEDSMPVLQGLKSVLRPLWRDAGKPCPYAVLVVADGDRMGRFLDRAQSARQHSEVSKAVAAFADQVPQIARAHGGHSVFNGGEDLTVLFPLSGVMSGARALAAAFDDCMAGVVSDLVPDAAAEDMPSLRVGAAICHVRDPLGVIRKRADAAEKIAKGEAGTARQGNALAMCLHVRAGHEIAVRYGFFDAHSFDAMATWIRCLQAGELPGGLGYELRAIAMNARANRFSGDVCLAEAVRKLRQAQLRGGQGRLPEALCSALLDRATALRGVADPSGLLTLADELIVARWLAARTAADVAARGGEG